jgi:large subunit ribosomal protein L35e
MLTETDVPVMQASMKTEKQKKKEAYFPMRKFAVKA